MNQQRLQRLKEQLTKQNLDGIALVPGPNMVYLSDIHAHLSERPLVLFIFHTAEPAIIIPGLEAMKAEKAGVPGERIFAWRDEDGYLPAFSAAATQLGLDGKTLGVESLHMRVLERETLRQAAPTLQTVYAEPILSALRMVKDDGEVAAIEQAVKIAEEAMQRLLPQIKIGMSEKQIAGMLTLELLNGGADAIAFGPIVSAGPNSASPHAVPTNRPLQAGDLLVIDWGCYVDGYPSDITRTFAVGEIDEESHRIYNAVKLANEQGKVTAAPGVTGTAIDTAARDVIEEAGYGRYFIHRTGHGLGLEVHEPPDMVQGNDNPLVEGNVFTVEPGIYLPGKGGVRIEDNVVITAGGSRTLTTLTRELVTVG